MQPFEHVTIMGKGEDSDCWVFYSHTNRPDSDFQKLPQDKYTEFVETLLVNGFRKLSNPNYGVQHDIFVKDNYDTHPSLNR